MPAASRALPTPSPGQALAAGESNLPGVLDLSAQSCFRLAASSITSQTSAARSCMSCKKTRSSIAS